MSLHLLPLRTLSLWSLLISRTHDTGSVLGPHPSTHIRWNRYPSNKHFSSLSTLFSLASNFPCARFYARRRLQKKKCFTTRESVPPVLTGHLSPCSYLLSSSLSKLRWLTCCPLSSGEHLRKEIRKRSHMPAGAGVKVMRHICWAFFSLSHFHLYLLS